MRIDGPTTPLPPTPLSSVQSTPKIFGVTPLLRPVHSQLPFAAKVRRSLVVVEVDPEVGSLFDAFRHVARLVVGPLINHHAV
jgi:hypothetical protein